MRGTMLITVSLITGRCRKCHASVDARIIESEKEIRMEILGFPCRCGGLEMGPMIDIYDWNWPLAARKARPKRQAVTV